MRAVFGLPIGLLVALSGAPLAQQSAVPPRTPPGSASRLDPERHVPRPFGEMAPDPRTQMRTLADPCTGRTDAECAFPRWSGFEPRKLASIRVPGTDGQGGLINYGGSSVWLSPDGARLVASCWYVQGDKPGRGAFAELNWPDAGGTATVRTPCREGVSVAQLASISTDPGAYFPITRGYAEHAGRTVLASTVTYDADNRTTRQFFAGPSVTQLSGPFGSSVAPGMAQGSIIAVPPEWRALLGGPLAISQGYLSIIGRMSYGPALTVFDPADVNRTPFPSTLLLGCPRFNPQTGATLTQCESRYGSPASLLRYNGSETSAGALIIPGTRTLVVFEREAAGPTCYGYATRDQALHGTPYPTAANPSPEGVPWCYSLSDPLNEKGPKGYPYRLVAKLVDLAELVAVKAGTRLPWDVEPYDVAVFPDVRDGFTCGYVGNCLPNLADCTFHATGQFWPGAGDVAEVETWSLGDCGAAPQPPPTPAWTAPLGLPTPTFGIAEAAPVEPSPWTATVGGFYFVCPTCSGATDSSNPNGYPTRPRLTLPNPIPAGSSVRVKGRLDGVTLIAAAGTVAAPVFVRGLPDDRPTLTREVETRGSSYLILEHLLFADRNGSEAGRLVIPGYSGATGNHVVIRDSEFTGNSNRAGGLLVTAGTNHVVFRNRLHDMGNLADTGDQDSHCMAIGGVVSDVWVVDNELARCSGDGMQINAGFNNNALTTRLYIGRNWFHQNKQAGAGIKNASDVIFSQNRFEDTQPSSSHTGACSNTLYGPQRVWWIFNTFERCHWGISTQSTSGLGDGTHTYIVGNRMIGPMDRAISLWPDGVRQVSVVNNTLTSTILSETRLSAHTIENNVTTGLTFPNGQAQSTARANVAPGQPTTDVGVAPAVYAEFLKLYGRSIAVDAEGRSRPQGAAWDIGAIEATGDTPPTPIDCVVAWGPYLRVPGSESACVAPGVRTYRAERTYTITTQPEHGGQACPAQPERQTPDPTEPCTMPPPPPSVRASVTTANCSLLGEAANLTPPAGTGWSLQFQRRLEGVTAWTNHGTRIAAGGAYTMSRQVALGRWEMRAQWMRTGSTSEPVAIIGVAECRP